MAQFLIIGYGNPLRGDDGLGWYAAERLRELVHDPGVDIIALQQLTPELMQPVSRAEGVIFIDSCAGPVPGEIRERVVTPEPATARFTHHATPEALLAGARALYGRAPGAHLISVAGRQFDLGEPLSAPVQAALESFTERWLREALSRLPSPFSAC